MRQSLYSFGHPVWLEPFCHGQFGEEQTTFGQCLPEQVEAVGEGGGEQAAGLGHVVQCRHGPAHLPQQRLLAPRGVKVTRRLQQPKGGVANEGR